MVIEVAYPVQSVTPGHIGNVVLAIPTSFAYVPIVEVVIKFSVPTPTFPNVNVPLVSANGFGEVYAYPL